MNEEAVFYCDAEGQMTYRFSDVKFRLGFVMFPSGPDGQLSNIGGMTSHFVIPGCYDSDRAWKLAFAYDRWSELLDGYEDYNTYVTALEDAGGNYDNRAIYETIPMMCRADYNFPYYDYSVPNLDIRELLWNINEDTNVEELVAEYSAKLSDYLSSINAAY